MKGMGGHQSSAMLKDEWITPRHVLDALGTFDLDPCAPINPPWVAAPKRYTIEDDGLSQPWTGRVFCNPPYGNETGKWLERMNDHGNGIALIFARTETDMFHRWVWESASAVLFLRGRLYFHHVDGKRAESNAGAPSCLVAYGQLAAMDLHFCALPGFFVRLKL